MKKFNILCTLLLGIMFVSVVYELYSAGYSFGRGWYLADELCCVCAGRTYPHRAGADADRRKRDAGDDRVWCGNRASILWLLYSASVECTEKRGHSFIYFYETWRHRSGCFGGRLVWRTPGVEPGTWFYPCDYSDFDDPS